MAEHTKEPWCYENIGEQENCYAVGTAWLYDDDGCNQIAGPLDNHDDQYYTEAVCFVEEGSLSAGGSVHGNAHRICVAVNFCAGYPTQALEGVTLEEVAEALRTMVQYATWQFDEGGKHHPTLLSATAKADAILSRLTGEKGNG